MRLLFLGGTQFVGRHMVEAALARGHEVTLFNRGQTNAGLFPQAEKLIGDRDGGLAPLKGRQWDAVIDVNGYLPRLVGDSASLLKNAAGQYVFVSTASVYNMLKFPVNGDESATLEEVVDPNTEEYRGRAYGYLKVLCEQVVEQHFPGRALLLRLGLVSGPYDPTDRITYWVTRVARGGEVLVPVGPDSPIQTVDARDLANFTILAIERKLTGIFNTNGVSMRWRCFLEACQAAARCDATFTFIDDDAFISANIDLAARPYGVFPMVLPPEFRNLWTANSDKALAGGMLYRSFLNTARDILAWDKTRDPGAERKTGLDPQVEKEVLAKWHSK